jgi:hypothetical protein
VTSPSQNPSLHGRGSGFLGVDADGEEVLGLEPQVPTPHVFVGAPDGPMAATKDDPPEGFGRERHGLLVDRGETSALGVLPSNRSSMVAASKQVDPTTGPV